MSPRKRPVVWISVIAVIALAALANYCAPRAPEQRKVAIQKLREAFAEYERLKAAGQDPLASH